MNGDWTTGNRIIGSLVSCVTFLRSSLSGQYDWTEPLYAAVGVGGSVLVGLNRLRVGVMARREHKVLILWYMAMIIITFTAFSFDSDWLRRSKYANVRRVQFLLNIEFCLVMRFAFPRDQILLQSHFFRCYGWLS